MFSLFVDVVNFILSAQLAGPGPGPVIPPGGGGGGGGAADLLPCSNCGGSVMSAVVAAFGTEGYYLQADILDQILGHGLQQWAIMAYVLSFIAGLISVAMGLPWKKYAWLVIGPPLFYWLLDYRTEVTGVNWMLANTQRDMKQVWKLAEPGLRDSNYILNKDITVYTDKEPSKGAFVSNTFAWYDQLMSDLAQQLVKWTGIVRFNGYGADAKPKLGKGYDLAADLKYPYIQEIVGARIHNKKFEQIFARFMESECGKVFTNSIDQRSMIAITNMKKLDENSTVMIPTDIGPPGDMTWNTSFGVMPQLFADLPRFHTYLGDLEELSALRMPTGGSVGSSVPSEFASESKFFEYTENTGLNGVVNSDIDYSIWKADEVNCADFFVLMMLGLRWEAAHIYFQLVRQAPEGVDEEQLTHFLLYGLNLDRAGTPLNLEQKKELIQNLILVHLFRNSIEFSPYVFKERRYTVAERAAQATNDYNRRVGDKNRYGQLYAALQLFPFMQGTLLYILAIAYPFACMLIVVPGMHSALFTWAQYWAWLKLWDVGFAICMVIERTVWGTLGNNFGRPTVYKIVDLISKEGLNVNKLELPGGTGVGGIIPNVSIADGVSFSNVDQLKTLYVNSVRLADRLLVLSTNIDLDLVNTYYIYIMTILIFAAVPAIGLFVLGSKSAIASMFSGAMGEFAKPAGQALEKAAMSQWNAAAKTFGAVGKQEAFAVQMRGGLAAQALEARNNAISEGIAAKATGMDQKMFGGAVDLFGKQTDKTGAAIDSAGAFLGGFYKRVWAPQTGQGIGGSSGSEGAPPGGSKQNPGYLFQRGAAAQGVASALFGLFGKMPKLNAEQAATVRGMGNEANQFEMSSREAMAGVFADRMGKLADQSGAQSAWDFGMDLANHLEPISTAQGNVTGGHLPGDKPAERLAFAMQGRYGSGATAAAYGKPVSDGISYVTDSYKGKIAAANQYIQDNGGFSNFRTDKSSGIVEIFAKPAADTADDRDTRRATEDKLKGPYK